MKRLLFLLLLIPVLSFGQEVYTYTVLAPSVLSDGNTVAWYIADDLTTITKDGSNRVSQWDDYLGSGHDLIQATDTWKPLWSADGILFDGVDNWMKTAAFTWEQPEMIYMVVKQVTWIASGIIIFDGNTNDKGKLVQYIATPGIGVYAGNISAQNNNLVIDTWSIVRVLFNGASSKLQVNETAATTGNFGANNMGGFTLASKGTPAGVWANIQIKEIILRNIDDTDADEQAIYNYLESKCLKNNAPYVLPYNGKILIKPFVFMDNVYKLNISDPPDFLGQTGFDIDMDDVSNPNTLDIDFYVANTSSTWLNLSTAHFESTDIYTSPPPDFTRLATHLNYGSYWESINNDAFFNQIKSIRFEDRWNKLSDSIAANLGTEKKLSDYVDLTAAYNDLLDGDQLNIDTDYLVPSSETLPYIYADDIIIYSSNKSKITIDDNNTNIFDVIRVYGDSVSIVGLSIDGNRYNQSIGHTGILLSGDYNNIIGCDVRNSRGHDIAIWGYGGLVAGNIGLVSGDDCIAVGGDASDVVVEFNICGLSDNISGFSTGIELDDGPNTSWISKNIVYGQFINAAGYNAHIHDGSNSIYDINWSENLSLYNTSPLKIWSESSTGETINNCTINKMKNTGLTGDVTLENCNYITLENCDFTYNMIYLSPTCYHTTIKSNLIKYITSRGQYNIIQNNNVYPINAGIGIYLNGAANDQIINNRIINLNGAQTAFYLSNSDGNIVSGNVTVADFDYGVLLVGTSDGNTGSSNNFNSITNVVNRVLDNSSGSNNITYN